MNVTPLSNRWEDIYHAMLMSVYLAPGKEIINHTFQIDDPEDYIIVNPAREFRLEFSKLMAEWTLSGQTQISQELIDHNPNAAKYETFMDHPDHPVKLCSAYGPRILDQVGYVVAELKRDPASRRACIMILADHDRFIADALGKGETKCEYICTMGYTFRISGGKLDVVTTMRSNNYTTTVCQDVYVVNALWRRVAELLGLERGTYYHSTVSAHIFPGEENKAEHILDAYMETNFGGRGLNGSWLHAMVAYEELKDQ